MFDEERSVSSMSGYQPNRYSNSRLNRSYHDEYEHDRCTSSYSRRSKRRRKSEFIIPSGAKLRPSEGIPRLSNESRKLIRRMALSAMVAVGTVCFICAVARWRELYEERQANAWIDR